jgi:hypothetical protein
VDFFKLADDIISKVYPGKPGWWGEKRIPNYGMLRGAIVAAIERLAKAPVKQKRSHKLLKLYYLWIKLIIEECEGIGMYSEDKKNAYHEHIKYQLLPEIEAISVCVYRNTVKSYYTPPKSIKGFDNKQMLSYMKDVQGLALDKYNMVLPLPEDRGYDQMAEKYEDWLK